MAAIQANCALCGAVLSARDIVLRVCVDLNSSAYTIRCPGDGLNTAKPANDDVVDILTSIGASVEEWHVPNELSEPRPAGAPIAYDDLLDFHLLLQEGDWFERLERRSPPSTDPSAC